MDKIHAEIKDAEGKIKVYRNWVHAWGAKNPFTFGTITCVVGFCLHWFFF